MKKTYKTPSMKVCNIMCEELMATSDISRKGPNSQVGDPIEAESREDISSKNLWDNEW